MTFHTRDGIRYLTFDSFPGITQAVFTRHGGLSPEPWSSLNFGGTVGDDRQRVRENRQRAFHALNRDPNSMYDVWQVHSADVVISTAPHPHFNNPPEFKADAIITDNPSVTLFMRFADCTPILLHDPKKGVVGIVHAGWMGTVKKAVEAAVRNAERNEIRNATFEVGDMRRIFTPEFVGRHGAPDVVVVDPPREGMHPAVVAELARIQAPKLVYVSCNPSTQARDIQTLSEVYEVVQVQGVDMFPQTFHVESVVLLRAKSAANA